MSSHFRTGKFVLLIAVVGGLLALALAGCGDSGGGFREALVPALRTVTEATGANVVLMQAVFTEGAVLEDADWQATASNEIANLRAAADALTNLPAPDDADASVGAQVQELASQARLVADTFEAGIGDRDVVLVEDALAYTDRVNELVGEITAAVSGSQ